MRLKKIINEYGITLFILILFLLFNFLELPFYIKKTGGLIDITDRIEIDTKSSINGSYNLAYVSELKATIPIYLVALFNKDWDIVKKEEEIASNENEKDVNFRNELALNEANNIALIVAYNKANKKIDILDEELMVGYVDTISDSDLKIGDKLKKIDNKVIKSKQELNDIISTKKIGDKVEIDVLNKNKSQKRYAKVIEYENRKIIGVIVYSNYQINTIPNTQFNFSKSESGSSGGFMMSLALYDYLVNIDLANGRKIAGTGTIDIDGNVGEISGVKYKIMGAINEKADIFFVPDGDNYKEALKIVNDFDLDIELVNVKNIEDAINYLKEK